MNTPKSTLLSVCTRVEVALLSIALGAYFLKWHTTYLNTSPFYAAGTIPHEASSTLVCTGFSHHDGSLLPPSLLVAALLLGLLGVRKQVTVQLVAQVALELGLAFIFAKNVFGPHFPHDSESHVAEYIFQLALFLAILLGLLRLGHRAILQLLARPRSVNHTG